MPLYAKKGDEVTCENGHLICRFARDVTYGGMQNPSEDFEGWTQEPPQMGALISEPRSRCKICGAPFWRPNGFFHIGNEWRVL